MFSVDVLSEDVILKWYRDGHVAKGKSVFLQQMKKFVEWLENAEEGMPCGSFGETYCKLNSRPFVMMITVFIPDLQTWRV